MHSRAGRTAEVRRANPAPRVLYADSDAVARELFAHFSQRSAWECDVVGDADTALQRVAALPYDVIITDLVMPDLPGGEYLRRIRESRPGQVIILVSDRGMPVSDVAAAGSPVDRLERPVDFTVLAEAVYRAVASVRRSQWPTNPEWYLGREVSRWVFESTELATVEFSLPLLGRLTAAGVIDTALERRLNLAVQEAVANALEHGNLELDSRWREEIDADGLDRYSRMRAQRLCTARYATRRVWVRSEYDGRSLTVSVRDEGSGFDPGVSPRESTEILCSGRGVAIIRGSVDEVTWSHRGTCITMRKTLRP